MSNGRTFRLAFWGALTVLGTVCPWYFNLQFAAEAGLTDIAAFGRGAFANPAASSMSADILIAAGAGFVLFASEARRLGMRHVWVYFLLSCTVAFAASFPLFLFMRERRLAELEREQQPGSTWTPSVA